MNKIIKIYTLLALVFSLSSCNLDKYPDGMVPTGDVMTTLDDAKQIVFGVYSAFKSGNLFSGGLTLGPDLQSDFVYSVIGSNNIYGSEYRWDIRQTDPIQAVVYRDLYTVIGRANFFLNNADRVEATLTSDEDKTTFRKCKGDVHFARALAYSEVIKLYCDSYENDEHAKNTLGIVLEDTFDPTQTPGMRSNLYLSYQAVLADLKLAETALDIRDYADSHFFTIGTVQALYARVYLYMGNWEQAEEYATKVIDNEVYRLADATLLVAEGMTDYDQMWIMDSHPEIIWKVKYTQNDYKTGGSLSTIFHNYGNTFDSFFPDYVPTREFVKSFSNDDYRYHSFFTIQQTGYSHGLNTELLKKYFTNPTIDGTTRPVFVNMPKVFRLSEQYLIRAEARYMSDDESGACSDITALRRARYNNYGTFLSSGVELFETIKEERKKELCMEGFRLNDLKRWGEGFKRVPQQQSVAGPDRLDIKSDNVLFVWPIPKNELDTNPGLQPNPSNK